MTTPPPSPTQYPLYPPPGAPPPPYGSAPVRRRPPTWLLVLGAIIAVNFLLAIVGPFESRSPDPWPDSSGSVPDTAPFTAPLDPPAAVVLPEVRGRNGQIVLDELAKLGLINVIPASADPQDTLVLVAADWTVVGIEPGPGETVQADQTVVVTMTKQN